MLPFRSFIFINFTLRFLIHFANFWQGHKVFIEIHFYGCGYPVLPSPFIEKTTFTLLYCLCFFVKYQPNIFVGVSFWALSSIPLIYMSFTHTILSWLPISYKSWRQVASVLQLCSFPSILYCFLWVFCISIETLKSFCWYP